MIKNSKKNGNGFTLIETIIYIALFSLLMGTAFVTAFQLIDNSGKLSAKNTIQEEGNFVMRKINWALTGAKIFSASGSELTINRYDNKKIDICLDSEKIRIWEGNLLDVVPTCSDSAFLPLTTDNIQVTSLQFTSVGTDPLGVLTLAKMKTINITPLDFTITKYIRK